MTAVYQANAKYLQQQITLACYKLGHRLIITSYYWVYGMWKVRTGALEYSAKENRCSRKQFEKSNFNFTRYLQTFKSLLVENANTSVNTVYI